MSFSFVHAAHAAHYDRLYFYPTDSTETYELQNMYDEEQQQQKNPARNVFFTRFVPVSNRKNVFNFSTANSILPAQFSAYEVPDTSKC